MANCTTIGGMNTYWKAALLLPVAVFLSGCLDVAARVEIRENGSGTIDLQYRIDAMAYDTGVFDDSETSGPFPVSRSDFQTAARSIDGLFLRRYRSSRQDGIQTVDVTLRFDSPEALVGFLGGESLSLESRQGETVWRQIVVPGGGSAGPGADEFAAELDDYRITYVIDPDRPIIRASAGTIQGEGDAVEFSVSLGEIARATEETILEVVW